MSVARPLVDAAIELLREDPEGWEAKRLRYSNSTDTYLAYEHDVGLTIAYRDNLTNLPFQIDNFRIGFFEAREVRVALLKSAAAKRRTSFADRMLEEALGSDTRGAL